MAEYIETLSELRSQYNCFDEKDRPYYEALSEAIARKPVVHGHWNKYPTTDGWDIVECSECGHCGIIEHNYCPDCGADMRRK